MGLLCPRKEGRDRRAFQLITIRVRRVLRQIKFDALQGAFIVGRTFIALK